MSSDCGEQVRGIEWTRRQIEERKEATVKSVSIKILNHRLVRLRREVMDDRRVSFGRLARTCSRAEVQYNRSGLYAHLVLRSVKGLYMGMTNYFFEGCEIILKVQGSKEVRVALGRCNLRPCLCHSYPRGIEFPVRSMSLWPEGGIRYGLLARATFSPFVKCSKVYGGRPVTFG